MRKILIGLGAVLVIVISAALVVPSFIDWNSYKGEIAAQAKAATGRDLAIDGDLDIALLPAPRLTVSGVRFANLAGGSAPDMVQLKSLQVLVRFAPLLQGKIEIDSIRLVEPVILLETLKDGRANWVIKPATAKASAIAGGPAETRSPPGAGAGIGANAVRLDNLQVEKGTLIWRDAATQAEERITDLSMVLAAQSLSGPFNARGTLAYKGVRAGLEASVGELRPGGAAPLSVSLTLPATGAKADVTGSLVALGAAPRFSGKIDVSGKDLSLTLSTMAGEDLPAALARPFLLRAKIQASDTSAAIDELDVELAGVRASGSIKASLTGRPRADAKLRITRIDLDSLLSKRGTAQPASNDSGKAASSNAEPAKDTPIQPKPFALPEIDATLDLGIDAVTYNGRSLRGIVVGAQLARGEVKLTKASLFLPGGGEVSMNGTLAARGGQPAYAAGISARADNFRSLLAWMGIDAASVPKERLHRFTFDGQIQGNDQQLQLLNSKMVLDTSRIDGALTLALRKRPAFGATITLDKIDLDAYLPAPDAAATSPAKTNTASEPAGSKPTEGPSAANTNKGPLSVLDQFDANLRLRVGQVTYRKTPVRDIRFDGTVAGGMLSIGNASVQDLAGVRAAISGTLAERSGLPVFKGTVSADARDITSALRLAGIVPPDSARSLGALKLRGKADAGADKADLDLTLTAAGADMKLSAVATGLDGTPRYDASLTARHKELSQFLKALGTEIGTERLGPFGLTARATGGLTALSANVRINAVGGTLAAKGTGSGLATQPVFDVTVDADHPAVGTLIRSLSPDYRPTGGAIGPLKLEASLKGGKGSYAVSRLDIQAGQMSLSGKGDLSTRGVRPALTATLDAGILDLNPFLPIRATTPAAASTAPSGGPGPAGSTGGKASAPTDRFSNDPFDTTPLGLMDADLSIGAKALLYRQFRVDSPSIRTALKDRRLTISEIAGKMFDGAFKLTGELDGRAAPRIKGDVTVAKANVGKALFQTAAFDLQGGITDFTLNVAGAGASPRQLIGALDGTGRLSSRDGIVKGFDLKAVSDRLKNLDGALDFLSLLGGAMGGGQTKFTTLDGTFKIDKGVMRTSDIKLVADAGEGRVTGFADMPRWQMDFNGEFHLTEHPKAPPFRMQAVGPIDNPRRLFDFQQLQSFILQRGIGSILRKVLPGKFGGSTGSSTGSSPGTSQGDAAPQQQNKPRLEDLLPGILDQFRR